MEWKSLRKNNIIYTYTHALSKNSRLTFYIEDRMLGYFTVRQNTGSIITESSNNDPIIQTNIPTLAAAKAIVLLLI